ncbi:hypothetical protein COTS27_00265 [Spirochaetota bacterium]|nr:hypothetical protein COTS27_00265 [Spirochaetota bacterium]
MMKNFMSSYLMNIRKKNLFSSAVLAILALFFSLSVLSCFSAPTLTLTTNETLDTNANIVSLVPTDLRGMYATNDNDSEDFQLIDRANYKSMRIGLDSITIESPPASILPEVTIPFTSSNCIEYSGSPIFSISIQRDVIDKANANEYVTIDLREFAKTNSSGKYFSDFRAALLLMPFIASTNILTPQLTQALTAGRISLNPTILTYIVVCNSAMSTDTEYATSSYALFLAKIGTDNYHIAVILRFHPDFTVPASVFNAAPACSDHFTLTGQTMTAKADLNVSVLEPCMKALDLASSLVSPMISIGGTIQR